MTINYAHLGDLPFEAVGDDGLTDRQFTEAARDSIRRGLTGEEITEHWQTAIHDELARDMRVTQLQQPQLILDVDGTMFKDRSGRPPGGVFDGLIAFVEDSEYAPSAWDRIEEIWQAVQVYVCILGAGAMLGLIGWLWLVTA